MRVRYKLSKLKLLNSVKEIALNTRHRLQLRLYVCSVVVVFFAFVGVPANGRACIGKLLVLEVSAPCSPHEVLLASVVVDCKQKLKLANALQ